LKHNFTVLIEQGEDGAYVATVPALKSCYTQADSIPELLEKIHEAIELCLEVQKDDVPVFAIFIGIQQVEVVI
jgi:predicted RNase H-like HicB family nuclease